MVLGVLGVLILAALVFWEFYICEGAHLGPRVVIGLYDVFAGRYDGIKQFDEDWERRFVGEPIANAVGSLKAPLVLDVGAGTGRVARAFLPQAPAGTRLVCLEPSVAMLAHGRRIAPPAFWMRGRATPLPFAEGTFDVVVSLELLEFTPRPLRTLAELVRVLRPGGSLLVTNRIGREARWIVGRTFRKEAFPGILESLGLREVILYPWQVEYDLAWAWKP
jgi:ubiquinone/menaquinone biosynthesis C-methylase UbiE